MTDDQVAWLLADAAATVVSPANRSMMFVEIGSGDPLSAIERILTSLADQRRRVDAGLFTVIDEWLNRYAGDSFEQRVREILSRVPVERRSALSTPCACCRCKASTSGPPRERPRRQ